jgi:hypothetical protein
MREGCLSNEVTHECEVVCTQQTLNEKTSKKRGVLNE